MNIENISVEELLEHSAKALTTLQEKLTEAITRRKQQEKLDLAKRIHSLAMESGFSLDELLNVKVKRMTGRAEAKYRNPTNPEQTWTGKGLPPKWLREATGGDKTKYNDYKI